MDLAIGAKKTCVMMEYLTKGGQAKLVPQCSYPLTGVACVSRVYTDHAVFLLDGDGDVAVRETYGISLVELRDRIGLPLDEKDRPGG